VGESIGVFKKKFVERYGAQMGWVISKEELSKIGNEIAKDLFEFCGSVYGVYEDKNRPAIYLVSCL
jgi:hypothetical protein